jgi:hypothetical protein
MLTSATTMHVAHDGTTTAIKPAPNGHISHRTPSQTLTLRKTSLQLVPEEGTRTINNINAINNDDKPIVGTKVEEGHSNYEIA